MDSSIGDYAERMEDVVKIVGKYEERSAASVFEDILGRFSGIVSVRVLGDDTSYGKIPIKDGLVAVAKIKSLFTAAALALGGKRPVFGNKIPETARGYLDSLLLGQTEIGSYVINAYAPSDWSSEKPISPTYGTSVISSMAVALGAIEELVQEDIDSPDRFAALDQAVPSGVSANLCDALLGFAGARGARPFEVTVKAPAAGLMAGFTQHFNFGAGASGRLRVASGYYKGDYIIPNVTLLGIVRELSRSNPYELGQVVVQARVADAERSVTIQLAPADYHVAVVAHDEGSLVQCSGNVRIRAGRATLLQPQGFAPVELGPALL
ncbi:hypothetical protein G6052_12750 [Stenotrophomonas maltophilia]|nr:hypothetical protein G6052_12750 [Stenotrophomonas maltophilia]